MFFKLRNLGVHEVTQLAEPWNVDVSAYPFSMTKDQYRAHYSKATTEHCLVSMIEGANPRLKVNSGRGKYDNQAAQMHGFIADYDGVYTPEIIQALHEHPPCPILPAWWVLTHSHKFRLIWVFEKPLRLINAEHAKRMLKEVAEVLKAGKWGADFDKSACENPTQYYDLGRKWEVFSQDSVIPFEMVQTWDYQVFSEMKPKRGTSSLNIPFDEIRNEIGNRWPGRVGPSFGEGAHCLRFWDPASDNATGCRVYKDGVRVYVPHDKPFMTWTDIFGKDFTDNYNAATVSPIVNSFWYHSGQGAYWRWNDACKIYQRQTDTLTRKTLAIEAGLKSRTDKDTDVSEVDTAMHYIAKTRDITRVVPLLFAPHGPTRLTSGEVVLNTSTIRVVAPAEDYIDPLARDWDHPENLARFPFIYKLITCMFMQNNGEYNAWKVKKIPYDHRKNQQLKCFLSWLSYFYKQSYLMKPRTGQVMILAGPTRRGKSYLARNIIGELLGGASDADKYFIDGEKFTGDIVRYPIMLLDDAICSMDKGKRSGFTTRLKTLVATGCVRYEEKFHDAVASLPWRGRVLITCNTDPQSLSVLPDLEVSNKDKVTMLKLGTAQFDFLEPEQNNLRVANELPYLARFLLNYRIPEELVDGRFGARAYHHHEMVRAAAGNSSANILLEALAVVFAPEYVKNALKNGQKYWEGTASELFELISGQCPIMARDIGSVQKLSFQLAGLQRSGYNVASRFMTEKAVKCWSVSYHIAALTDEVRQMSLDLAGDAGEGETEVFLTGEDAPELPPEAVPVETDTPVPARLP